MPRIRSIKPEITSDVGLSRVSRDARLTFIYSITQADDVGLLAGNPRQLLGALYPLDDDVTVALLLGWIEELVGVGLVAWRATRDGVPVLQLVNWAKHQRIDNAGRSQLGALLADASHAEHRRDSPRTAAKSGAETVDVGLALSANRGDSPLGPPTTDLGSPTTDHQVSVAEVAIALSVRANQGLAEHPTRPQPIARIIASSGRSYEAAEAILQKGIPLAFAESEVYAMAKSHNAEGEVTTLNYFVRGVVRAWGRDKETRAAAKSAAPASRRRLVGSARGTVAAPAESEYAKRFKTS